MTTGVFLKRWLRRRNKWQHKEVTNVYIILSTLKELLCWMFIMLSIGKIKSNLFQPVRPFLDESNFIDVSQLLNQC